MKVSPEYTSRTYKDQHWGYRDRNKGFIAPYINGSFLPPMDDQINAAHNVAIRAFNRHANIFAVNVVNKDNKVIPVVGGSKRKEAALTKIYGQSQYIPLPTITEEAMEILKKNKKMQKLYFFEKKWTTQNPDDILKALYEQMTAAAT